MIEIKNCFDSHVHFMATGQVDLGLKLHELKSAEDIRSLSISEHHYKKNWLMGFGWDQHRWSLPSMPDKHILDKVFPDTPVFFSRVDGHASWLNTAAILELEKLGFNFNQNIVGGVIHKFSDGSPSGILVDQAHIKALLMLPEFNYQQLVSHALRAIQIFNQGGFSHIRDLSSTSTTVQILHELSLQNQLNIFYEGFVTAESLQDIDRAYQDYCKCLNVKNKQIRMKGLKIFIDGSLGSKTAYLSKPYAGTQSQGLLSWNQEDLYQAIVFCWKNKIDIAIHAIGDEAADIAVNCARQASSDGYLGKIHLEHVQILRPETILKMKSLHLTCHMQPVHWMSDKLWLQSAIPELFKYAFSWNALTKNNIDVQLSSDSPIEVSSIVNSFDAIEDAYLNGVEKPIKNLFKYHQHPDQSWGQCLTRISEKNEVSLSFKIS